MFSPPTHFWLKWLSYTTATKDFILLGWFTKYKILLLGWTQPKNPAQAGICVAGSSLADLGNNKLTLRQLLSCSNKGKQDPRLHPQGRYWQGSSLLSAGQATPGDQSRSPTFQGRYRQTGEGTEEGCEDDQRA